MIVSDGYSIEYYSKRNQIEIQLPQTIRTLTNTTSMVVNRKLDFTNEELMIILSVVKALCQNQKGEAE